jgi:hypothetical protein
MSVRFSLLFFQARCQAVGRAAALWLFGFEVIGFIFRRVPGHRITMANNI